ncbi:hypothetical protein U27_03159 [Candidatus Vecturithrix granuli]|uniref:Uncharacterized protein n=1 Tax=Vecturithrix granuli TaxID=1499967 RepID=A0A081BV42_VECG1|nr:hypothetical protein U27_03159 [Candidatus Vecturithrix granuli]
MFVLVMFLGGMTISVNAAQFLSADFALLRYDSHVFESLWIEGGAFSDVLQRDCQERQRVFLPDPKNDFVRDDLKQGVRKKGKLMLSPKVFIRPVIIVEELQTFFKAHQSEKTMPFDENVRVKAILPLDDLAHVQPVVTSARIFSFMPYYHKVYGIYLQIIW